MQASMNGSNIRTPPPEPTLGAALHGHQHGIGPESTLCSEGRRRLPRSWKCSDKETLVWAAPPTNPHFVACTRVRFDLLWRSEFFPFVSGRSPSSKESVSHEDFSACAGPGLLPARRVRRRFFRRPTRDGRDD